MKPPSPATLRAYTMSRYSAGGVVAHVGTPAKGRRPDQARTTLVFLGACNPGGRRYPDGWNARMMQRLRDALGRTRFVDGAGGLHRWSEAMLMASMDPRRAVVVARRFRQNAVVLVSGRRTRLLIL